MKSISIYLVLMVLATFLAAATAAAHCEVPCGIYDDKLRANLIAEHTTTVEKSMKQIMALSKQNPVNYNQLVRWISNKEKHAEEIQHIVTQYFMTQRINLDTKNYAEKVGVLHKMLVYAMKCKQTIDLAHIQSLRSLLKEFEALYFGH
jgi:nickel superoxide dismutase